MKRNCLDNLALAFEIKKANMYAIDVHAKHGVEEDRIKIFKGSQTDPGFLEHVCREIGAIDIIIDDGSHVNKDVIATFELLFPALRPGGTYVVEDVQTAYWPYEGFGGDSDNLNNPVTSMNYFKGLTDCLNHQEFIRPGYAPSYFDKHIGAMCFYHNLVFMHKGYNTEPSNVIVNNSIDHIRHQLTMPREAG